MSDDMDLEGLTDRQILILLARTMPGRINDHGRRLRALETFRNWASGAGVVAGMVLGALKLNISVGQK